MKKKIFYPWNTHSIDEWKYLHENNIEIYGTITTDYYPKDSNTPKGKQIIIYYKEKNNE